MKILHTSDWHLGHRLHEQSQHKEQEMFLQWLHQYILKNNIDVLLISGDIFDTGIPSSQSQKLYYDFLIELRQTNCKEIIITGGNHDAPGTINAPKALLQALSIHVIGKATDPIENEVLKLNIDNEEIIVAAAPFLRDQDIRRAVAGETFDQITDRYKNALVNHYNDLANYCKEIKSNDSLVIAMGHLFALGGSISDSEQSIYVGNLGYIGAQHFPKIFDYVALGHLHKAQKVGNSNHIRYSGSPYILSFSEVNHKKQVIEIETKSSEITEIKEVELPVFRSIRRIEGDIDECIGTLKTIDNESHELTPWVEVILKDTNSKGGFAKINNIVADMSLEVLKVSLKGERKIEGLEKLIEKSKDIKELSPINVFKMKCDELNFDLDKYPEILDAYHELLQLANDKKGNIQ